MKHRTTFQLFAFFAIILTFASCSSEQELKIEDSEFDKLTAFVDQANVFAHQYDELTGPIGSEIFGNNKAAVCGNEHDFVGPCIWAIDDIVETLGYEDISEINQWMLDNGSILYELKKKNDQYESQKIFIQEIACLIAPEILTRNETSICYKSNLEALLNSALKGASSHSTNFVNNTSLKESQMYEVGSSFYKVWRYMVNMNKCQ